MPGSGLVKLFYLFAVNILISTVVLITASQIKVYFANTTFTHISCGHTSDFYLGKTDLPGANSSKISRGKFISGFT